MLFKRTRALLGLAIAPIGKLDPLFREVEQVAPLGKLRNVTREVQCLGSVVQVVVLLAHRNQYARHIFNSDLIPDHPINEIMVDPFHMNLGNLKLKAN